MEYCLITRICEQGANLEGRQSGACLEWVFEQQVLQLPACLLVQQQAIRQESIEGAIFCPHEVQGIGQAFWCDAHDFLQGAFIGIRIQCFYAGDARFNGFAERGVTEQKIRQDPMFRYAQSEKQDCRRKACPVLTGCAMKQVRDPGLAGKAAKPLPPFVPKPMASYPEAALGISRLTALMGYHKAG